MPLYEYECESCGRRFEVIQKFSDAPPGMCTLCGKGPVRQLMSSPAIQFKGSGWYITDYARKGKTDSSDSSKSDAKDTKAPEKSAEGTTKTETAPPAPASAPTTAKD